MNKIKSLTNEYLYQLAQTSIDSMSYAKVVESLKAIDALTREPINRLSEESMKAVIVDKLCNMSKVDKISINDNRGFQIDGLDLRANGMGPATILIIGKGGKRSEDS